MVFNFFNFFPFKPNAQDCGNPFSEDDVPEADRSSFSNRRSKSEAANPFGDDTDVPDATDIDSDADILSHAESTHRYQWDLDRDVSDFVDFTPIHKSLHIHNLLGIFRIYRIYSCSGLGCRLQLAAPACL